MSINFKKDEVFQAMGCLSAFLSSFQSISCVSSLGLIPKHFIIFKAMINGIVFLISIFWIIHEKHMEIQFSFTLSLYP